MVWNDIKNSKEGEIIGNKTRTLSTAMGMRHIMGCSFLRDMNLVYACNKLKRSSSQSSAPQK